ncbi:hypothetical protein SAMN06265361_103120 [Laceyella tengchongensis]|uniref:Uncharacterized protein n=1 Tax=Laceyella tengchongensis TaxID=574699 RepID=A0AA45WNC8_9BACL|nr:hypothetical protein SAMN06265361_103120 [Laceyella tengchongensis]
MWPLSPFLLLQVLTFFMEGYTELLGLNSSVWVHRCFQILIRLKIQPKHIKKLSKEHRFESLLFSK